MISDIREQDDCLSKTFKRLLATAVSMLLVAIIGGTIAFYLSYKIGHIIVLSAVITGNACFVACVVMRISGHHLAGNKKVKD
jgi:hypothetical protein